MTKLNLNYKIERKLTGVDLEVDNDIILVDIGERLTLKFDDINENDLEVITKDILIYRLDLETRNIKDITGEIISGGYEVKEEFDIIFSTTAKNSNQNRMISVRFK